MSKRKPQGGTAQAKTVYVDGKPHQQYTVETKASFITIRVLTPDQLEALHRAAVRAHANAIGDWLTANLGAQVTGDIQEYLLELAPVTGRLNS